MMKFSRILLFFIFILVLAACKGAEPESEGFVLNTLPPTTTDIVTPTQTPKVDTTQERAVFDTPEPSPDLSVTATPAAGETLTPSATPWIVYVISEDVLAMRTGPGVYYRILDLLPKGTAVYILGTEPARKWFLVHRVDEVDGENEGWVFGEYLSIDRNNLGLIPVVSATPTPEPVNNEPDLTATQQCKWLENKGTPCP
jgi:uncharacterized protein YgiM (DUF1202 family)